MKCIGLIGGMSWESTVLYYQILNREVRKALGGLHSAHCIIYSVDFEPVETMQHRGDWAGAAMILHDAATALERAGADFLVLCTNTMHILVEKITNEVKIPFLHIADATGDQIAEKKFRTVGLLGTRFTMEKDFYKKRLSDRFDIRILIPPENERVSIHRIIYDELCNGIIHDRSREEFRTIIRSLAEQGAEAVILGCTEIGMLVKAEDSHLPLLDTTVLHAQAAVRLALSD